MATLSLFPARIRFTNADGTLTPEAYRALQVLFQRVGGTLGDNGEDVFAVFGGGGDADNLMGEVSARETLMQTASPEGCCQFPDLSQAVEPDLFFPDVVQPVKDDIAANALKLLGFTWAAPDDIGGATRATGNFTTLTADVFRSFTNSVSATTGTATTVYSLPNTSPRAYLVNVNIGLVFDANNFSAFAVILADGGTARIALSSNAAVQTITLSGLDIQSTQFSGSTQTMNATITRIA